MPVKLQRIVLLGTGNVGSHLAKALFSVGFNIVQVYSRTLEHAEKLAETCNARFTDNLSDLANADLYIVAIKDDALTQLAAALKLPGKMVVHTSGAMPTDALANSTDHYGVFYPLQTFTAGMEIDWTKIPICIEAADEDMLASLQELAESISKTTLKTTFADRQKLHVAAVFVNNFTNHLLSKAEAIMGETSLPFSVLQPLAEETIRKAFKIGPENSQTGPAIRGDKKTISAHETLLSSYSDILKVYRLLTDSITGR